MVRSCRLAVSRSKGAIRAEGAFGTMRDHDVVARRTACNLIARPVEQMQSSGDPSVAPPCGGRLARNAAEDAAEMGLVGEAAIKRNFAQRRVGGEH